MSFLGEKQQYLGSFYYEAKEDVRFLALLLQRSWDWDTSYGCNITKPSVSMVWEEESKPNSENGEKTSLSPQSPPFVSFTKRLSIFFLFQAGGFMYPTKPKPCLRGDVLKQCQGFWHSLPCRSCSPVALFSHMCQGCAALRVAQHHGKLSICSSCSFWAALLCLSWILN